MFITMKITIDESVCKKHNLSFAEVIGLLFVRSTDNAHLSLDKLENENKILKDGNPLDEKLLITNRWDDEVSAILLESDDSIPPVEDIAILASKLREIFPKGMKVGTSAWRGNLREITLRLQKFFKLYGNQYSSEDIINATKKNVEHFNGDYRFMRILKYFIMKTETKYDEDGVGHNEDVSELANFLENDCVKEDSDDWMIELR